MGYITASARFCSGVLFVGNNDAQNVIPNLIGNPALTRDFLDSCFRRNENDVSG
jgi:hypothetical protein